MGGSSDPATNSPVNLVLLCRGCHRWVESHRSAARLAGWLVWQGQDPAVVVVLLPAGPVWLTEDGGYVPA
jgi:5-methylcytosine-specific restriction protein A